MSAEISCQWQYLAPKAGSHYRQLFIKGTRIAARTLYGYFTPGEDWAGQTVEELAADFNLPVAAVREAIAYCQSDPPEICEDLAREEALMAATGMNDPNYKFHPSPQPLQGADYQRIYGQ